MPSAFVSASLSNKTAKAAISKALIEGHSIDAQFDAMSQQAQRKFVSTMVGGIQAGDTLSRLAARMSGGTIDGEAIPGFLKITRSQSMALTHTAVTAISKQDRIETFRANRDIISAIQQVSTLDNRTTEICIAYSDLTWDVETLEPIGHSLPWAGGPPRHFNCRSVIVPVVKSPEELGLKTFDKIPEEVRSSMDGQVPSSMTFADWLNTKSKEFVADLLGKAKAELFIAGKLDLKDLIDFTGAPRSIEALASLSISASASGTGFTIAELNAQARKLFDMDYSALGLEQRKKVIAKLKRK